MVWITIIGLIASIITIWEFVLKRNGCKVFHSNTQFSLKSLTNANPHADITCKFSKEYKRKSLLIFSNEGECTAHNIRVDGLDQFHINPIGMIPPILEVGGTFKLSLNLLTTEVDTIVVLNVTWDDKSQKDNRKKLHVTLT